MKSVLLVIVALHSGLAIEGLLTCSPTSVRCINSNQYVFCVKNIRGEGLLVGNVLSCPDNSVCDENSWFPCVRLAPTPSPPTTMKGEPTTQEATTTLKPTTKPKPTTTLKPTTKPEPTTTLKPTTNPGPTTLKPTTKPEPTTTLKSTTKPEPTTLKPTTNPGPTTLKPTTKPEPTTTLKPNTTPQPTTLKPSTSEKSTTIDSTHAPSTTLPPIKLPDCSQTGAGRYPSASCHEYLECVKNWWWYDLNRVTCPENQLYDTTSKKCAPSETVECLQRTV